MFQIKSNINRIKKRVFRYTAYFRWLIVDSLGMNKWLAIATLATGFLGVSFQVQVYGMVILFAKHFSSGENINIVGYALNPRNSMGLLAGGSIAIAICFSLSTFFIYFSKRSSLRLSIRYEEFCSKRAFHLLSKKQTAFPCYEKQYDIDSYLFRLVKVDSRFAGRVLRMILNLIVPAITLSVAVSILVYLEAGLTFMIFLLSAIFLFLQYKISRQSAFHSLRFEQLIPVASKEYKMLIQHFKHQMHRNYNVDFVDKKYSIGPVRMQLDAYEGRLIQVDTSRLVSGMFMAFVLGIIMMVMGGVIILEGTGWERLLTYIVALRFAMQNLQNVFTNITSINRFYPQVHRYFKFIQNSLQQNDYHHNRFKSYDIKLAKDSDSLLYEGTLDQFTIYPGAHIGVVSNKELNRYTLAELCDNLFYYNEGIARNVLQEARYASIVHSCPQTSLRHTLRLPNEATWKELRKWFPNEERWLQIQNQLPKDLDKPISQKIWERVSPELKFMLSLISSILDESKWIFMQSKGLHSLDPTEINFYLKLSKNVIAVTVYKNDFNHIGILGENAVIIFDEDKIVGIGSPKWFHGIKDKAMIRIQNKKNGNIWTSDDDDDDLDLDLDL
jgi:hypothetical protein